LKRFAKYRRSEKYGRKLWNDLENIEERQVE
jgi:hypothetical protein